MRRLGMMAFVALVALVLSACTAGEAPKNGGADATAQESAAAQTSESNQDAGESTSQSANASQNISDVMDQTLQEYYQTHGTILADDGDEAGEEGTGEDSDELTFSKDVDAYAPDGIERNIVGTDDRVAPSDPYQYPYSAIAYMTVHFPCKHGDTTATGFMVRPSMLLTAAHALYCEECQTRAAHAEYYFGCYPDGSYGYKYDGMTTVAFGTKYPSQNRGWDYAIVRFDDQNVGDETGYFGCTAASNSQLEGKNYAAAGYRDGVIKYDVNKTYVRDNGSVWLYADTLPGNSGGPIYDRDMACGIIVASTADGKRNVGCRITREVIDKIFEVERAKTSQPTPTPVAQQQTPLVVKPSETGARGFILPYSATHVYTRSELAGLSTYELYLARNEIPARHGYLFENQDLQVYFASKSWYHGTLAKDEFRSIEGILNTTEETNVETILAMEREQGSPYVP
ncbi:MAG: YARHG domain-containing protein [Coriobacteriales bacterium]|nr:YARHG domain-containing protein [Coriobacteriales bacterium]